MPILLTSRDSKLLPVQSADYREELLMSPVDAQRLGIRDGSFGILKTTNVIPDVPGREYAVRVAPGAGPETGPGTLLVNSTFYEELQFGLGQEWELWGVERYVPVRSLSLEPSVEQERLKDDLRRMRRGTFVGRCMLVEPGTPVDRLSLRVSDQAYFNVHHIDPAPAAVFEPTIFGIEDRTEINMFIPHRKGGIDMVVVVDASNSMDLRDYVDRQGSVYSRVQAARRALETLLANRLYSGSRVSRFALVAFGKDAKVIYPQDREEMVELTAHDIEAMRKEIPNLFRKVDRLGSNIAEAMDTAAELLYKNAREDNEKVIVLLSDGGHWVEKKDTGFQIEFQVGHEDAVMFADNLYDEGQIRIHTVAVSTEDNLRRYEPNYYKDDMQRSEGQRVWTPNPKMLNEISRRTRAKSFSSPDADVLNNLFEDLGKGAMFPLL